MKSSIITQSLMLIGCLIISSCTTTQQEDEFPTIGEIHASLDENSIAPVSVEFRYWNRNKKPPTHEVIATNADIETVEVKKIDSIYKYYLVIETTEAGTDKLKNSIGKYPDSFLAIIIDNKLLFSPIEQADIHSGKFRSESFYDIEEMVRTSLGIMKMKDQKIPNQRVDLTVKTPVESGNEQGTAGHP